MIGRTAIILAMLVATPLAQGTSAPASVSVSAPVPQVPEDVRRLLLELRVQVVGLERAKTVIQRELDHVEAEFQRTIARIQVPAGYELLPDLTMAKKPESNTNGSGKK